MKTGKLRVTALVLGASLGSVLACSAKSENTERLTSAGASSRAGGGGATPGAGSGGANAAGAPATAGAAPAGGSTAVAGSPGVAGSPVPGGGGAPTGTSCKAAVGVLVDAAIDDLEDGDNAIQALGQRVGYWYTYNDGSATQIPAPDPLGLVPFKGTAGGHSPMFSAHTSGPAFTLWGAGLGFDFNNTASKSCTYDASAYTGMKFWAKGNVAIKAMVKIPATTPAASNSGSCAATSMCEDHYGLTPKPLLTSTWTQYTIDFSSTTTFAQDGWGTKVPFDKKSIIAVQFQVGMAEAFDFAIDDVTFY